MCILPGFSFLNNLFLTIKIKAFELSHFLSEYCITYWMTNGYRYSSHKRKPDFLSHSQLNFHLFKTLLQYMSICQTIDLYKPVHCKQNLTDDI